MTATALFDCRPIVPEDPFALPATPAFDPADPSTAQHHPMWPDQIDLEKGMRDEGAEAYVATVDKARRKGHMARLEPVRHLLLDWVPKVSEFICAWRRAYSQGRGPKPTALPLIQGVDPDLLATITLRTVLNRITARATNITPLCIEIGRFVEHELRMRAWERHDRLDEKARRKLAKELAAEGLEVPEDLLRKGSWRSLQDKLTREFSSATHRRIVNAIMFNTVAAEGGMEGVDWTAWSVEQHFRVGSTLLEALCCGTNWFTLENDPNYVWKPGSKKGPALALLPRPEMLQWLSEALDREQISQPVFKPTLMPPKRWESTKGGGYWTPYARTPRLIRFKASQAEQREGAADEYEALDMPEVYSALAFVQETGWAVNTGVFHVAQVCYDRGIKVNGMVSTAEISDIIEPEDIAENADARKIWRKAQASVYRARHEQATKMWALEQTISLADEFASTTCFYFPHMLDFRGRMYPIPSGMQPQGNDLARGLLRFNEGLPVTEENGGAGWIAVQLASMWGNDKWDFDKRIAWVEKHNDLWQKIASDPIGYREDGPDGMGEGHGWVNCDKPFQALAAILDWAGFLREGYGYCSFQPIQVDGTCNGIQHLAAMTRDEVAGKHVNLVPGTEPRDIYRFVAEALQAKLEAQGGERTDKGSIARWWIETFRGVVPRSATKRQVMVLPYGGTLEAFRKYVAVWLKEYGPERYKVEYTQLRFARVSYLANLLWETVGENVKGAVQVMNWLKECAKATCVEDQPIHWVTPSGFVVRQFYGKVEPKRIDTKLNGENYRLNLAVTTDKLSVDEQIQGIAPNFVHSLDAAALTICANKCKAAGISHFTAVHDAYGTHAANMTAMGVLLREAFVEVHRVDNLENFRDACARTLAGVYLAQDASMGFPEAYAKALAKMPAPLGMGTLDLEGVMESPYFFA